MVQLKGLTCRPRIQSGLLLPAMLATRTVESAVGLHLTLQHRHMVENVAMLEGEVKTYRPTYGVCCCGASLRSVKALHWQGHRLGDSPRPPVQNPVPSTCPQKGA